MNEQILMKAHDKFTELYGSDPDIRLLNRFYDEKRILENSKFCLQNLELVAKIRREAEKKGEHISLKGAECSLFIAYLLGATEKKRNTPLTANCRKQRHTTPQLGTQQIQKRSKGI